MNADDRRITWENFDELVAQGAPAVIPIAGAPAAELFITPAGERIGVRIEADDDAIPDVPMAAIEVQRHGAALQLSTRDPSLYKEFFAFTGDVIDRCQLDGLDPLAAVDAAWRSWNALLQRLSVLSVEKQLGLIGELWLLLRLGRVDGWTAALDAWHDVGFEEHDFSLSAFDLEVKTTSGEKRRHYFGLTQLVPAPSRPLFLLSLQLTRAGAAASGFSLGSIVKDVLDEIEASVPAEQERCRLRLTAAGWQPGHAQHYTARYVHRTEPRLIEIGADADLRGLTPDLLQPMGHDASRVVEVTYRLDVDGLGEPESSSSFRTLVPADGGRSE